MVFKKKKGRGPTATGRPAAPPEELCYSNLDADEKRDYDRQPKQASRGTSSQERSGDSPTSSGLRSGKLLSSTPPRLVHESVGRPPLNDDPMTTNTLKARKRELYHQHATETVSSKRASAAKARWTLNINPVHSSGCQDDSGSELEEMSIDSDEELNEGHLVPELNPEDEYDWTSSNSTCNKRCQSQSDFK
ncbi:hypothetical protein Ahia01_001077600 [Argonauta hians]